MQGSCLLLGVVGHRCCKSMALLCFALVMADSLSSAWSSGAPLWASQGSSFWASWSTCPVDHGLGPTCLRFVLARFATLQSWATSSWKIRSSSSLHLLACSHQSTKVLMRCAMLCSESSWLTRLRQAFITFCPVDVRSLLWSAAWSIYRRSLQPIRLPQLRSGPMIEWSPGPRLGSRMQPLMAHWRASIEPKITPMAPLPQLQVGGWLWKSSPSGPAMPVSVKQPKASSSLWRELMPKPAMRTHGFLVSVC